MRSLLIVVVGVVCLLGGLGLFDWRLAVAGFGALVICAGLLVDWGDE